MKKHKDYFNREELIRSGAIIGDIPEGNLVFQADYRYLGRDKKTITGRMVVQVWHKASVEQALKDRLYMEKGWEKGWIFIDSIQQMKAANEDQESQ
ncbi:hypothetical protein [Paenibacillus chitinolyticus]|uniref:hypothetical protein n=1 Tax=Paenibacillus chitinolyticus TaxID=79263 RepID=UPI001C48B96D|nr:hypothetical protein [Paenibacillus chitinolyticus]MBV6717230.1 hypothetical protein [Paenibacillus chitinolyticus]